MNNDTGILGYGVSADDIRAYDWQNTLVGLYDRQCTHYTGLFRKRANALQAADDDLGFRVFSLLGAVASFWPNFESLTDPYGPELSMHGKRSPIPADLTVQDLDAFSGVLPSIKDPEFRARIADVLWIRRKDYRAAQLAVDAYLEAANILEDGAVWTPHADRLHRALIIGAQIDRRGAYYTKVVGAVESAIGRHAATDTGLRVVELMRLLLGNKQGAPANYATIAETLARRAVAVSNWDIACACWECKAGWEMLVGNSVLVQQAQIEAAETFVKRAEEMARQASCIGAAHWQSMAVQALRQARANPARIEEVHRQLLEYQRGIVGEMKMIELPTETQGTLEEIGRKIASQAENCVKGKALADAILQLAFISDPTDPIALRKRVEDQAGEFIFTQLAATTAITGTGRVAGVKDSTIWSDPAKREETLVKDMFQQSTMSDWPCRANFLINPARIQVLAEHPLNLQDMAFIVHCNPFLPPDREGMFARGLLAGFHGDMVFAMHILVPQLENSIRLILETHGVITSKLDPTGIQDERDFGWLLSQPKASEVFGAGTIFDLRGLLTERFGHNLRNNMAHGLLGEETFYGDGAILVWWYVLRLCCMPLARKIRESQATAKDQDGST